MMKKLVKNIVIFAVALGIVQVGAMIYFGKVHADLAERYALSEAGLEYATTCENRLNWHDQELNSGRETLDGCGCIAGRVAADYPDDMAAATVVVEDMINWLVLEDGEEADWASLAAEADIDEGAYSSLLVASLDAMGACNVSSES